MTYRGRVRNGVVLIEGGAAPPEGSEVEVSLIPCDKELPTLAERYKDLVGILEGLPPDASTNHDQYLYGTPSR